jgi:hypothetical protein
MFVGCRFNHVNACVVHLKVPHSTCFVKFVFSVALKVILRILSSVARMSTNTVAAIALQVCECIQQLKACCPKKINRHKTISRKK